MEAVDPREPLVSFYLLVVLAVLEITLLRETEAGRLLLVESFSGGASW